MISAVIPLFNEETNCLDFTIRLATELSKLTEDWEMILMIGGHDKTLNLCSRFWHGYKRVKIFYEPVRGLGTALQKGFLRISPETDYVLTMDGDGQNLPEEIPKLFETLLNSQTAAVVVGEHTHLIDARSRKKRFISKVINKFFAKAYDTGVSDHTSNFRVYKDEVIWAVRWDLRSKNFEIQPELIIRARRKGYKITECQINFPPRNGGWSKLSFRKSLFGYGFLVLRLLRRRRKF